MTQKKRRTKGSAGDRRSHHALKAKTLNICPKCKKTVEPHKACSFCGSYKKTVIKTKESK
ncbi:MAG: 50S ribosomal protein L32 [bacterium]